MITAKEASVAIILRATGERGCDSHGAAAAAAAATAEAAAATAVVTMKKNASQP